MGGADPWVIIRMWGMVNFPPKTIGQSYKSPSL